MRVLAGILVVVVLKQLVDLVVKVVLIDAALCLSRKAIITTYLSGLSQNVPAVSINTSLGPIEFAWRIRLDSFCMTSTCRNVPQLRSTVMDRA